MNLEKARIHIEEGLSKPELNLNRPKLFSSKIKHSATCYQSKTTRRKTEVLKRKRSARSRKMKVPSQVYAVAGFSGSSKPEDHVNEDRFDIARLPKSQGLFLAVFDGHGGTSASTFASRNIRNEFVAAMGKDFLTGECLNEEERILQALSTSFANIDRKLYRKVLASRQKVANKDGVCKCRFFLENPCLCMRSKVRAREGSTATVVILDDNKLHVANVGDSEAVAFSFNQLLSDNQVFSSSLPNRKKQHLFNSEEKEMDSDEESSTSAFSTDSNSAVRLDVMISDFLFRNRKTSTSASVEISKLTVVDTPTCEETNSDYLRIKGVADRRRDYYQSKGITFDNGIKRGRLERLNYVRFPGAHSLNMTRALGDFGLKSFDESLNPIVDDSPIISAPHIKSFDLSRHRGNYFLVIGSDGLWDNLTKNEVFELVIKYLRGVAASVVSKINNSEEYKTQTPAVKCEVLLAELAGKAAKFLVNKAVKNKKKLDDVTAVIVLFNSILDII